jgi:hypothetical protein
MYPCDELLLTGRPRGRSSGPGRIKNLLFSTSSRRAQGSTQPPNKWVPGAVSLGAKWQGREADHSPPTSVQVKKIWISSMRLHGVVLNYLSTGTALPYLTLVMHIV